MLPVCPSDCTRLPRCSCVAWSMLCRKSHVPLTPQSESCARVSSVPTNSVISFVLLRVTLSRHASSTNHTGLWTAGRSHCAANLRRERRVLGMVSDFDICGCCCWPHICDRELRRGRSGPLGFTFTARCMAEDDSRSNASRSVLYLPLVNPLPLFYHFEKLGNHKWGLL